jgi:hypothetical protein
MVPALTVTLFERVSNVPPETLKMVALVPEVEIRIPGTGVKAFDVTVTCVPLAMDPCTVREARSGSVMEELMVTVL